ncbi:MAG: sensor domain-containing diguanylate cyclase [Thalassotalea sp.]
MSKNEEGVLARVNSLETILNNVGSFIYTKDIAGCYTYVNDMVVDLFQLPREQILGKDDSHFFDLEISDELQQNDQKVMTEGLTIESEEHIFIRALGELRICKSIKKPMYDIDNNIIGLYGLSTELSEFNKLKQIVKEQRQLLDAVLDNVDAHVYMKDNNRKFLYVNNKVIEVFGRGLDEIIGKRDDEILPKALADHFWQSDKLVFETKTKQTINESIIDEAGNKHHFISTKIPYKLKNNEEVLIGFSSDVTELFELKERFQKQATTDSLTDLYNRRYFLENAAKEFHRAKRYSGFFSIINIDVDNFKLINDTYGHPVGDQVLITITQNILPMIRAEDTLARIGGEEFAILLPNTGPEKAQQVAKRICQFQAKTPIPGDWGDEINATISVGVTCMRASDNSFQELFTRSDKALYQAKDSGKNKVTFLE